MGKTLRLHKTTVPAIEQAISAFLDAQHGHPESSGTRRVYASTLRLLADRFAELAAVEDTTALGAWFTQRWGGAAPATWNRNLDAVRSATKWWAEQGWLATDPGRDISRRKQPADRTRALSRNDVDRLLARDDIGLREKVLWRLLYESAARAHEVLCLDVEDLNLPNRSARVRRKGGVLDVITWRTGTARLLPRLLKGRKSGPVFLTDRRARLPLGPADVDRDTGRARLSYRRAGELFKQATGGWTLHQLRHSALTHAAEDGASTPMLMSYGGHTSPRSLVKYARVSAEAVGRWQQQRDPARRR